MPTEPTTIPSIRAVAAHEPGLRAAQAAPRCSHVRYNGQQCGCPALRDRNLCRYHDASRRGGRLPFAEDAAAIQIAVMRVLRGLEEKTLDTKTAAIMLYGLQIACSNLKRLETAFAVPTAQAEAERERSLVEDLLDALNDEEFIDRLNGKGEEPAGTLPPDFLDKIQAMAERAPEGHRPNVPRATCRAGDDSHPLRRDGS